MERQSERKRGSSTFEKFAQFLGAALAIAALFGLLYNGGISRKKDTGLKEIGVLIREGDDVKIKPFGEGAFSKTRSTEKVFLKDSIYAGAGTKVALDLGKYGKFDFVPNAVVLLMLDFEEDGKLSPNGDSRLKISLDQGKMFYKKSSDPKAKAVSIGLANGVSLKLDKQKEVALEKNPLGEFKLTKANFPADLEIESQKDGISSKQSLKMPTGKTFIESEISTYIEKQRVPATEEAASTLSSESSLFSEASLAEEPEDTTIRGPRTIRLEEDEGDDFVVPAKMRQKQEVIESYSRPASSKK